MITHVFNVEYPNAHTLEPSYLGSHSSGWTISGEIHEDFYEWVNEFEATHPIYGKVWGDFETEVYSETLQGYEHFIRNHPPEEWDYGDI